MRFAPDDIEVFINDASGVAGRPWLCGIGHQATGICVEACGGSHKDAFLNAMDNLRAAVARHYDMECYRALFPSGGVNAS